MTHTAEPCKHGWSIVGTSRAECELECGEELDWEEVEARVNALAGIRPEAVREMREALEAVDLFLTEDRSGETAVEKLAYVHVRELVSAVLKAVEEPR